MQDSKDRESTSSHSDITKNLWLQTREVKFRFFFGLTFLTLRTFTKKE